MSLQVLFRLLLTGCLFGAVGISPGFAQLLPSELHAVWPAVAQSGTSTVVKVDAGVRLDEAESLVFSHPGITATVQHAEIPFQEEPVPTYGVFDVQVAPDVPEGYYDVRMVGRHGTSNPRRFRVTSKPVVVVPSPAHELASATTCTVSDVIAARATPATLDYFAVEFDGKESIDIRLRTQSLDSRCIGLIQLLNADGKIIGESGGGDGYDPMLDCGDLPAGRYYVTARDFLYRGGAEFSYLLEFSKHSPINWLDSRLNAVSHASAGAFEGLDLHAPRETEAVTAISLPHEGCWWFSDDGATQSFDFEGSKGQAIEIELVSERLGEPTDARFQLFRIQTTNDGESLVAVSGVIEDSQAINDGAIDLRSNDPVNILTLPETSKYRLQIRDLDVGKSVRSRQRFVLRVKEPNPRYTLVAYRPFPTNNAATSRPFASKIALGGAESIRVFAIRQGGFAGSIQLSATQLAPGILCDNAVIAANQNSVTMTIRADETDGLGPNVLSIVGRQATDASTVIAKPATIIHAKGAGRDFIQTRLSDELVISRASQDIAPLSIQFAETATISIKAGEGKKLAVNLVRQNGAAAPVVLRTKNLVPGMTAADVTVAADQSAGEIDFKVAGNVPPGVYTVWLQAESKVKVKPNPQAFERAQKRVDQLKALRDGGELPPEQADLLKSTLAQAEKDLEAQKPNNQEIEQTVQIPSSIATIQVEKP